MIGILGAAGFRTRRPIAGGCKTDGLKGLMVVILAALAACAGPAETVRPAPAADDRIDNATPDQSIALDELGEIIIPQKAAADATDTRRLFTLQMKDARIQDLLLAFSEQTGINISVDPEIDGKVTVDLKRVTLEQAMDTVLSPLGLEYTQRGNLIKVFKPQKTTRIFHIDYIVTSRTGSGLVSGSIGGRETGGEGGRGAGRQTGSGGYSEVLSSNTMDLWSEIQTGLDSLKSPEGNVSLNRASNSIVVIDYPGNIARIAEFLQAIQGAVQRQVIIEASIIEVTLDETFQAGVNWNVIQNLPNMSNFQWGLAQKNEELSWSGFPGKSDSGSDEGGSSSDAQMIPSRTIIRPFSGVFSIGTPGQPIFMTDLVEALTTQGDVDILSNPRITTMNNQPAIIKVAREDVYFQTIRTTTSAESTTETSVNFLTVGIVLSVTPQISGDGVITMTIHPSITEKAGEKQSVTGDSVPIINVRETETVARVRNNDTILIGGLMQEKVDENVVGLPVLRDIPYLGMLFKHVTREKRKTELVILLTPRILADEMVGAVTAAGRSRVEELRRRK